MKIDWREVYLSERRRPGYVIDFMERSESEDVMEMKIVAQIEKLAGGQYLFNGKVYDSFLNARREMSQWMKRRQLELAAAKVREELKRAAATA